MEILIRAFWKEPIYLNKGGRMSIPQELKYTEEHEWARKDGDVVTVGITDYAQGELGDVVYLDLPAVGDHFDQNDVFGSIEAVKDTPETINTDPYGIGWMVKIKIEGEEEYNKLMDADAYNSHIGK
jgi:glycine cleavage system H protein